MNIQYKYFICLLVISKLWPISAPKYSYNVEQIDGNKIPVRMFGHEYYNWIETDDGYVINWVEVDDFNGWYYQTIDVDGYFIHSDILVTYPAPNNLMIPKKLRELHPQARNIRHSDLHGKDLEINTFRRSNISSIIKPIVFLVDFEELPSSVPEKIYNKEQFQHLLFGSNISSLNIGLPSNYEISVRDYYKQISNEQFDINGNNESIIDWTTVDHDYNYYVDASQGTGNGVNGISRSAASLVVEIAMKIESSIDFSNYDGNEDGEVDVVLLIVEGWTSGDNDQFWPHMSIIQSGNNGINAIGSNLPTNNDGYFSLDGVAIKKYILIPEQYFYNDLGNSKGFIHPIGTICHELGHVLGLPDLYDTSTNSLAGIGEWGLMGSGNWQKQNTPAYMSAWSRYSLGFINPLVVDNIYSAQLTILPAEIDAIENSAVILPMNSKSPLEYLILENRQKLGADQYLQESGLLVWHIDEIITEMYPAINSVNINPDFFGVNLIQADQEGDLYEADGISDTKDPFPGDLGVISLNDINTNTYDRSADGIINIGENTQIEISDINEDSDGNIKLLITNPNILGNIIAYDEGGYEGIAFNDIYNSLQWAGIKIVPTESAVLSGIETVFPPTYWSWEVSDYSINIWHGWSQDKPVELMFHYLGNVEWNPDNYRDGGWAFISLIKEQIYLNKDEIYYIEINYNGEGGVYPFDKGIYSNSISSNMSYFRGNPSELCTPLSSISSASSADWNIRAIISNINADLDESITSIPIEHTINTNYPNPFNPTTIVPIYISYPSKVSCQIFNISGRIIEEINYNLLSSGNHELKLNMSDYSSGIYFYNIIINNHSYGSRKMILVK